MMNLEVVVVVISGIYANRYILKAIVSMTPTRSIGEICKSFTEDLSTDMFPSSSELLME